MSHSLAESKQMMQAVRKTDRSCRSACSGGAPRSVIKAKRWWTAASWARSRMAKPMWNWNVSKPLDNSPLPGKLDWKRFLGNAPDRDLEPMRFRYWRYFWDYSGGNMTDQGTHLMDVVQWFANSGNARCRPCVTGRCAKNTGAEVPDVFSAVFEYPSFMATWTLNYCNSYDNDWAIVFQGDDGTMVLTDFGFKVYREPFTRSENHTPIHAEEGSIPVETHVRNFLECLKSRQQPNATVELGARAVAAPQLANLAFHQHRQVKLPKEFSQWLRS